MCGIYGSTKLYSNEVLKTKLNLMKFRGPDHQEFQRIKKLNGEEITLGHVRLAIMDLDARSDQPFRYNENITIVFNGEIYNYQELKKNYLSEINFRTESDTEVICAMYEKFGKNCVNFFNGMFAYVIFDKRNNVLVGARDRLGKKPFYYKLTYNSFEFASQVNSIIYNNECTINELSRQFYLLNGYIPDPYSIYKEITKLRAGQLFTLDLSTYQMEIEQYWDIFSNSCNFSKPRSYNEAKEVVKDLLFDAVKIRLNADVPVGMFLSGGIDSSIVSAIVSKINKDITAYTIGFEEKQFNESNFAKDVAHSLGIPIKINYCDGTDMLNIFKDMPRYFDEPFSDNSLVPTSLLAEKTRNDVTVALGGDGGDELFWGYYSYSRLRDKYNVYKLIPYKARKIIYSMLRHYKYNHYVDFLRYRNLSEMHTGCYHYGNVDQMLDESLTNVTHKLPDLTFAENKERGILAMSDYDMKYYLNSCINTKADRASMRSSLELRSPIMDYRLAEYSRLLPYEYLYDKTLGGKHILKDILYDMVPKSILDRPKTGFGAPVGSWLRKEVHADLLDKIASCDLGEVLPEVNEDRVNAVVSSMINGNDMTAQAVFKIYVYLCWYNKRKQLC